MSARALSAILCPGGDQPVLWAKSAKGALEPLPASQASRATALTVASPTRTLLSIPLWLPPHGDTRELCELEIAARHLARRGQQVAAVELERDNDRVLALAVLPSDDPVLEPHAAKAVRFEAPARLLNPDGADSVFWREEGLVCFAFYRSGKCCYFAGTGEAEISPDAASLFLRSAQRLHAEEILPHLPKEVLLLGDFNAGEAERLHAATGAGVRIEPEIPPPILPADPADFPPSQALTGRRRRQQRRKLGSALLVGAAVYLAVAAALLAVFAMNKAGTASAQAAAASERPQGEAARLKVERWKVLRPAVDPSAFVLDQFAAAAAALPAETVRFTQVSMGGGVIVLSGEASEVAQTYELLERLKAAPELEEFEWTAKPPNIVGRNTIRFEIEGRRPDANADSE